MEWSVTYRVAVQIEQALDLSFSEYRRLSPRSLAQHIRLPHRSRDDRHKEEGHRMASLIGKPIVRIEDERMITGKGRYVSDIAYPDQVYAAFFRSPHAHARISYINTSAALEDPAVLAVFTG